MGSGPGDRNQPGRDQARHRRVRLASMGSGPGDRNQIFSRPPSCTPTCCLNGVRPWGPESDHNSRVTSVRDVMPQWGPALGAGIRRSAPKPSPRDSPPQWGPALGAGISRWSGSAPATARRASMGSGPGGRNQGSGKTGPVSRQDTGSRERCQQVGMMRHGPSPAKTVRWSLTCRRALTGYRRSTGPLAHHHTI